MSKTITIFVDNPYLLSFIKDKDVVAEFFTSEKIRQSTTKSDKISLVLGPKEATISVNSGIFTLAYTDLPPSSPEYKELLGTGAQVLSPHNIQQAVDSAIKDAKGIWNTLEHCNDLINPYTLKIQREREKQHTI